MNPCDRLEEIIKDEELRMLRLEQDYEHAAGEPGLREELGRDLNRAADDLEAAYEELHNCRDGFLEDAPGPF